VSPPFAEEPDPLLAFSTESGPARKTTSVPEPAGQPVAAPVDPPRPSTPSVPIDSLVARLDRLERALEDSKARVSSVKSELATLVRVVADIRKQSSGRPAIATAPIVQGRRVSWTASAIVGALLGMAAAAYGWTYFEGGADVTITAPVAAESAPPPVTQPAPELVASTVIETPKVIDAPKAPKAAAPKAPALKALKAPQAPQAPQAPRYVGTLSIDADPGGDVFVDRESAGHTPVRLTNLRAGSHLVWIERNGYRRFTRVVQVPADRVTRLSAELEPIASR